MQVLSKGMLEEHKNQEGRFEDVSQDGAPPSDHQEAAGQVEAVIAGAAEHVIGEEQQRFEPEAERGAERPSEQDSEDILDIAPACEDSENPWGTSPSDSHFPRHASWISSRCGG